MPMFADMTSHSSTDGANLAPALLHPLRAWWAAMLIVLAAVVAYHNSFHGPFVFDDESSIVTNPTIRSLGGALSPPTHNVTAQGRPILNLSLALNYAWGGTDVEGYHALNLLIHALAGLTLFGILRRTLLLSGGGFQAQSGQQAVSRARWLALAIAVLWTVHPLQTESVTYVIQRAESLVGLFYLLTLYCFVRGAAPLAVGASNRSGGWLGLAVAACVLGMATKEVMVTAPLMVLFFDRTFLAGTFVTALRRRPAFYAALAVSWSLLVWLVAQTGGNRGGSVGFGVGVSWAEYWLTQFQAITRYLWLSFWPHPLVFEYGTFWVRRFSEVALPMAVVVTLLGATVMALWRRSAAGFLGAWFFGVLAPTSLAPGTTQMIVEHRMYLPLAAVMAAAVIGLHRFVARRGRAMIAWVTLVTAALTVLTVRRNDDYRSDVALWADTVAKRPSNPLAHFMLAGAHERAGSIANAMASYRRTLELKPDFSIGHEHFGELLLKQGRRAEAIEHLVSAIRLQPAFGDAHANLGNAYLAEGRVTEAVGHLERAAELVPASPMVHYNLGNALAAAGLADEAAAQFLAAIKLDPTLAAAHFNLANSLVELNRPADALPHYEAAVKAQPDYAAAHYNLANLLAASGRQRDAVSHYEAALRARPEYPEAHHNLGSALFELGDFDGAARHYAEALRLAPDFPNARENLERARTRVQPRQR